MPEQQPGLTPSGATAGSGIGGAIAVIFVWYLSTRGIFLPAGVEAALAVIISTLAGYIPKSGRR